VSVEVAPIDDDMIVTTLTSRALGGRGGLRLSNLGLAGLATPSVVLRDVDLITSPRRYLGSGLKPATGSWGDPHISALEPRVLAVYEHRPGAGHGTP
jgi:hypothetical protein